MAGFAWIVPTTVSVRGAPSGRGESISFNSTSALGTTAAKLGAGALLGRLAPPDSFLVLVGIALVTIAALVFVEGPTPSTGSRVYDGDRL